MRKPSEVPERLLVLTADDFGIGPETSRGILDLARAGVLTSTVLLVNSPYAEECVTMWREAGCPIELGWHPCLTLDAPVLPPERVPSLVGGDGQFLPLGCFLRRLTLGRVREEEVDAELRAQFRRFRDLVGQPPTNVNAHHHVHIFRRVGNPLLRILAEESSRSFVRRVVETRHTLRTIPGARLKRAFLTGFGEQAARRQAIAGFPGNETLAGVTDPPLVWQRDFFRRWIQTTPGSVVELICHPGHWDKTLAGRDGSLNSDCVLRRAQEFALLSDPALLDTVRAAGFRTASGADVLRAGSSDDSIGRSSFWAVSESRTRRAVQRPSLFTRLSASTFSKSGRRFR